MHFLDPYWSSVAKPRIALNRIKIQTVIKAVSLLPIYKVTVWWPGKHFWKHIFSKEYF